MPDHVGETLDGATIDIWTGMDAMRWTPEPPVDPLERALRASRARGTGPAHIPAGKARRPRRHQQ